MPIKSCAAHAAQLAHSLHGEAALPGSLRDQRADRFAPTLMRRKASPKKSSSSSCCPTLRSSSAIRFRAASNSPRPALASDPFSMADPSFRGLPPRRCTKPASPNSAYRSFQTYSRLRRIPNSCAIALTLSPANTRRTAANFNSIEYSACFGPSCDMRSPLENCHHFLCLSFGVHSSPLSLISLSVHGAILGSVKEYKLWIP